MLLLLSIASDGDAPLGPSTVGELDPPHSLLHDGNHLNPQPFGCTTNTYESCAVEETFVSIKATNCFIVTADLERGLCHVIDSGWPNSRVVLSESVPDDDDIFRLWRCVVEMGNTKRMFARHPICIFCRNQRSDLADRAAHNEYIV